MIGFILSGCAKPAPTGHDVVEIKIMTAKFGGVTYTLGAGLADMINKHSTWLRATPLETSGCFDDIKRDYDDPTERRFSVRACDSAAIWAATEGVEPYDTKYTGFKYILYIFSPTNSIMTCNPDIKTPQDLVGKTVNMSSRGSGMNTWARLCMDYCWGLEGQYEQVWLGYGEAKDGLMDGTIDATVASITINVPPEGEVGYKIHQGVEEPWLMKSGSHFLSLSRADFDKGVKAMGVPTNYIEVPAGTFGDKQPEPVGSAACLLNWMTYDMDDEWVYEIARVANEYYAEMGDYHAIGKGTNPRTLAWLIAGTEDEVQAGALQYYKEHDIPVFVGGEVPF